MNALERFFEKEVETKHLLLVIFLAVLFNLIYGLSVLALLKAVGVTLTVNPNTANVGSYELPLFVFVGGMAVAYEEAIFRIAPLALLVEARGPMWLIILTSVVSSAIFGALHSGLEHLLFQGIFGLISCALYLKCGGYTGNVPKGSFVVITEHFLFNLTLYFL